MRTFILQQMSEDDWALSETFHGAATVEVARVVRDAPDDDSRPVWTITDEVPVCVYEQLGDAVGAALERVLA